MSLRQPGPGEKPKSSIFSALSPAPAAAPKPRPAAAPAPAAAPVPAPASAPKPALESEALTALKLKMEALEKKLIEQARAAAASPVYAAPPPPPARSQDNELLKKIAELEHRLADFGHSAALSASQLKNIEESKISARREIEDLLKAVREQQKYSGLDRQMHEQLERAWARAEEVEKKLMEFYASVLALETRRTESADRASDKTASAMELFSQRLEGLERKIWEGSPAGDLHATQEEFFRRVKDEVSRQEAAHEIFLKEISARVDKLAANDPAGELRAAQDEFFRSAREEAARQAAAQETFRAQIADSINRMTVNDPAGELRAAQDKFFARAREEAQRQAAAQQAFQAEIAGTVGKLVVSTPAGELRAAQDEFFTRAREEDAKRAAAQEALRLEMIGGIKESSKVFKEIFENYVRVEMELLGNKIYGETEALRREMAAATDESRKFLREQSAFASEKAVEFEEIARANSLKADAVTGALDAAARSQAAALDDFSRRLQTRLVAMNADFSAAVKAENDARFEKFGAKYADALLSVTFIENFRAAVSESLDKFGNYGVQLVSFLKEVDPEQMEKVSGVSGMMVRRQFAAMKDMLGTLDAQISRLRGIKRGVEEKFGDIFKDR
ncbi:MAG: hypothetical protein A2285_00535 [Elusimicrobia bacterium RIFOXYA12_FULL_57_11]|nr:MAG: hypothetical protein A2285_00535 [Elusimicrobia bacterium RIFOXYA12_FULL_57_11]